MPRLDAWIPEGALSEEAENNLLADLTTILLRNEGADPNAARTRSMAWVWVHRPAKVFAAGEPAAPPRYRFEPKVPEGQFDDERRSAMVAEITEAVLDAENGAYERDPLRVWVFPSEVPDGTWGAGGRIFRLSDIVGFALGDAEKGRQYAEKRLAERRGAEVVAQEGARMNEDVVAAFRRAVETGDSDAVLATFAPEIRFANPVSARPFVGHDVLAIVVPRLLDTWQDLRYVAQLEGDDLTGLIFDAGVGSESARGIDVLRLNEDGLIAEITVMVRPLKALKALQAEMAPKLAAAFSS